MDELKLFENPEFGKVRAVEIGGEPWFVGRDVAVALGYENPARSIRTHVDDEDKGVTVLVTPGGTQEVIVIRESGLYSLIMSSKLKKAREFKRWVTSEVLPTIRKTGGYAIPKDYPSALRALADAEERKLQLEAQVEADRPSVQFAKAVEGSYSTILVRDLAKILRQNGVEIGEKRLFEWFRQKGYLIRQEGRSYNLPTQRALESGFFEVKETAITHTTGTKTHLTPLVTGKGQKYFVNLFLASKAVDDRQEA